MGPEFSLLLGVLYTIVANPAEIPIVAPHFRRQFCTASPSQEEPMKVSRNDLPF